MFVEQINETTENGEWVGLFSWSVERQSIKRKGRKNVLNVLLQEEKGGKSIIRNRSAEEGEETEGVCAR